MCLLQSLFLHGFLALDLLDCARQVSLRRLEKVNLRDDSASMALVVELIVHLVLLMDHFVCPFQLLPSLDELRLKALDDLL